MFRFFKVINAMVISSLLISAGLIGCGAPKPSNEESGKLQEARAAAESAERKLSDLRQERMKLEQDLQAKQQPDQSAQPEQQPQ